jgi:hypothetical protein
MFSLFLLLQSALAFLEDVGWRSANQWPKRSRSFISHRLHVPSLLRTYSPLLAFLLIFVRWVESFLRCSIVCVRRNSTIGLFKSDQRFYQIITVLSASPAADEKHFVAASLPQEKYLPGCSSSLAAAASTLQSKRRRTKDDEVQRPLPNSDLRDAHGGRGWRL